MVELLKNAGPFAFLNLAAGAVGLLLALATLATGKSNTAKVLGVVCLVGALAALSLGFVGYHFGMVGTHRALGNVPDDMRDLLLRKGTEESRSNYIVALAAALLPLLAGLVSASRTGFRPGMVLGAITVVVSAAMGAQLASPLPPGSPPFVEPPALTLAQSTSSRELRAAGLIALTPDGLWANGARVTSIAEALAVPLVTERNATSLPLMVDARVRFSALADLVEAAEQAGRSSFQLVVLSPSGAHHVISVSGRAEEAPRARERFPGFPGGPELPPSKSDKPGLALTLRVGAKAFEIGAVAGTLDPLPPDTKALNDKLAEVKAAFPDEDAIRVTAEPELPFAELVKALDATVTREGKLLFPNVIVGRFPLTTADAGTHRIGE